MPVAVDLVKKCTIKLNYSGTGENRCNTPVMKQHVKTWTNEMFLLWIMLPHVSRTIAVRGPTPLLHGVCYYSVNFDLMFYVGWNILMFIWKLSNKLANGHLLLCWYGLRGNGFSIPFLPSHTRLEARLSCGNVLFSVCVKPSCLCMIHVIHGKKISHLVTDEGNFL